MFVSENKKFAIDRQAVTMTCKKYQLLQFTLAIF